MKSKKHNVYFHDFLMNSYLLKGIEFPYLLFLSSEVMVSDK
jgi:hypothetical protein